MASTGTTPAELLIDIDSTIRVQTGTNTITPTTHSGLLDNIVKVLSGGTSNLEHFVFDGTISDNSPLPPGETRPYTFGIKEPSHSYVYDGTNNVMVEEINLYVQFKDSVGDARSYAIKRHLVYIYIGGWVLEDDYAIKTESIADGLLDFNFSGQVYDSVTITNTGDEAGQLIIGGWINRTYNFSDIFL